MIRSSNHNPAQLVAWRLGTTATPLEIPLVQYDEPPRLAANDEYLAVLSEDRVQLFSVDPWEPIGSAAIPKGARVSDFSILTDGSVRLFTHDGQFRSVKIFDLKGQQMVTQVCLPSRTRSDRLVQTEKQPSRPDGQPMGRQQEQ